MMAGAVPLYIATKKTICCAIDFGTSRSGYGFSLAGEDQIITDTEWADMPDAVNSGKTLTQLLYEDNKCVAWGFSAPKKLAEIAERAEVEGEELPPNKYTLLRCFKMALKDPSGLFCPNPHRSFRTVDIIAEYLRLIWARMEERISKVLHRKLQLVEIKWCLTIPAIWTETEKALMRQAAVQAGLITKGDISEDNFMLVLEPEAAAAWSLEERKRMDTPLMDGESFLIVDAGGGTVDLTAHMIHQGQLMELTVGSGGLCGSSSINTAFWKYLQEEICQNNFDIAKFSKDSPLAELALTNEFDCHKCKTEDYTTIRNILVPDELAAILNTLPQKPAAYIQKSPKKLRLTTPALQTIFAPTITAIENLVREQFIANTTAGNKSFDYVGGFGASKLLLAHLQAKFASGVNPSENVKKVIQPTEPGMAIICGAVLLGKDSSLIKTRRMRATYGIEALVPFIPGTHKADKKTTLTEKLGDWCLDALDKFVITGEEMKVNQSIVRTYKPQQANQRSMSLTLYVSPLSRVIHTDDNGVRKLGEIIIEMPDVTNGLARTVEVNMFFGKTEIRVSAIEGSTKKSYEASIKFDLQSISYHGSSVPLRPKNYHIIFLNDVSVSMTSTDAKPSLPWMQHINRVGALFEACYTFLQSRQGMLDLISCILYEYNATTLFRNQPNDPEKLTRQMMSGATFGGTNFHKAVLELEKLLQTAPTTLTPIAIFMTDGQCKDEGTSATLQRIMSVHGRTGFTFHCVLVGKCLPTDPQLLPLLAQIGNGTMSTSAISLEDMKKTYVALAALLE